MTKTFYGLEIHGDPDTRTPTPQRPASELAELIRAVQALPEVDSFGWQQWYPAFNDGDPCYFKVSDAWFKPIDAEEDEGHVSQWELYGTHPLGTTVKSWRLDEHPGAKEGDYIGEHEQAYRTCSKLNEAIDSGAFDDALQEHFGEFAEITINDSGIHVDIYEPLD